MMMCYLLDINSSAIPLQQGWGLVPTSPDDDPRLLGKFAAEARLTLLHVRDGQWRRNLGSLSPKGKT